MDWERRGTDPGQPLGYTHASVSICAAITEKKVGTVSLILEEKFPPPFYHAILILSTSWLQPCISWNFYYSHGKKRLAQFFRFWESPPFPVQY